MLETIRKPVEEGMEKFNRLMENNLKSDNAYVSSIVEYAFSRKGKQMRPLLVLLSAGLNGEINDKTYVGAVLVEMTHAASLIHDDVIDEAFMRRGQLSVNAIWRSKTAVLAGDYVLAKAMTMAFSNNAHDLVAVITGSFEQLSEGELIQMDHASRLDMTEEIYFDTIRKKTASLLGSCGAIGAVSAGCGKETVENMRMFGEYIGMAFQIRDDILDYESGSHTGKPALADVKERKITLPLIRLMDTASAGTRREIIRLLSTVRENEDNALLIQHMVAGSDSLRYSESVMDGYRHKALNCIGNYSDSEFKRSLELFCDYILTRNK